MIFGSLFLPCLLACVAIVFITILLSRHALQRGTKEDEKKKEDGFIPCPWAWPLVGNLPELVWAGYRPETLMMKWAREYGEIFSFQLGFEKVVVLNDYRLINTAWHHAKLQNRAAPLVYIKALGPGKGMTFANGEDWKECRTFVLNMFKTLGVGKKGFEDVVRKEGEKIIQEINRQECVLDVSYIFSMSSCNIVSKLVFNQQLDYTDSALKEQVAAVLKHFRLAGPGSLNCMTPFFAHLRIGPGQRIVDNYKIMKKLWSKQIQEHLKKEASSSPHNDIVDAYLAQLRKQLNTGIRSNFKIQNLLWLLRDLYLAGTETTSTTLRWALLFLATHPEKQRRCHEELDRLFCRDDVLSYADHTRLPYINAFILESLRLGDILPLGVAHEAAEDVMLGKYFIPKGTIVASNIRAVTTDASIFPEPDQFNPERFLTDEGNYRAVEEMMPFGVGKRICPGEQLARIELFHWFTQLIQKFDVKVAGQTEPDILAAITGLVRCPLPFTVKFVER